jgi:hypothetical protein
MADIVENRLFRLEALLIGIASAVTSDGDDIRVIDNAVRHLVQMARYELDLVRGSLRFDALNTDVHEPRPVAD